MSAKKVIVGCGLVSVVLTGFLCFLSYQEWYQVVILRLIHEYHFGSEGPSPYYYQTPSLYAKVMFTWGTVWLLNLIYVSWTMVRRKISGIMIGFGVSIILVLVMYMHGQVGIE